MEVPPLPDAWCLWDLRQEAPDWKWFIVVCPKTRSLPSVDCQMNYSGLFPNTIRLGPFNSIGQAFKAATKEIENANKENVAS